MKKHASHIKTFSGKKFDYLKMDVNSINIEDIAQGLSNTCRWTGQVKFYCPTENQRILKSDLSWVKAGTLKLGDKLLSFDEKKPKKGTRCYREASITFLARQLSHVYKLILSDGSTVECSDEHPWLMATEKSRNQLWKTTKQIIESIKNNKNKLFIHKYFDPWETEYSFDYGWFSGILDGEGFLSYKNRRGIQLGIGQKEGVVLDKIKNVLIKHNFQFCEWKNEKTGVVNIQLRGGYREIARLLGIFKPIRLLKNFNRMLSDTKNEKWLKNCNKILKVVDFEDLGVREVVVIETSTRTYFCEGLGSHNCVAEHCCHVARAMYKAGYSKEVCLAGLLHDASEAYCADVPSPLKRLCTAYAQIERKTRKMIIKKYTGLSHTPPVVWDYDMKMLATEHKKFFPGKRPICEEKPLDGVHIRNWTPYVAKRAFLNMFSFLTYN